MTVDDRDDRGSILLETVIATAILALILAASFEILQGSAMRSRRIGEQRVALMIAQSRLAEYGLTVPVGEGRRGAGTELGYRWRVEAGPAESPDGPVRVSVTVTSDRDSAVRVRLDTLRPGARS